MNDNIKGLKMADKKAARIFAHDLFEYNRIYAKHPQCCPLLRMLIFHQNHY